MSLYIVDGSYYIFRAYYALRGLSNSKGFPTNALYGFVGMLRKLIDDEEPTHILVTFDLPSGKSFRSDLYPEYKATRSATPDDLVPQLPLFRDIVRAYNIPVVEHEDYEADDVIGSLIGQAVKRGLEVVVVTGDKDLTQIVSERVVLLDTMRDRRTRLEDVKKKYGVAPEHVPDILGLMGDSSDNIPGVPGVGEKTAVKLLSEHGSLDGVYENLDQVKGKLKERLAEHREAAFLSRRLATIETDLNLELDLEGAKLVRPNLEALVELFTELEFERHLEDLEKRYGLLPGDPAAHGEIPEGLTGGDKHYRAIASTKHLEHVVEAIRASGRLALVVETNAQQALGSELVGLALSWEPNRAVYIPIAHHEADAEQLGLAAVHQVLGPLLEDPAIEKVGHNTKFARIVLQEHGIELSGVTFDVMLASYVLDPSRRSHTLEALSYELLGVQTTKYTEIAGRGSRQKTFDFIEVDTAAPYAAEDADVTLVLAEVMRPMLEADDALRRLHDEIELPLSVVLAGMERHGVLLDPDRLDHLSREFAERAAAIEAEITEAAGVEFNINSPKQLAEVLFERLELPVLKRTKTGPSTDQSVLEQLADEHPLPALILAYRSLTKLRSTYTDALPALINPKTGRIHTEFRQDIAATGRLSSNHPNLQNIPVRTDEGRRIREAFIAPPGMLLFSADYSQVELRLLAHMSGDPVLLDAFRQGQDIHARTAAELFDVPPDQVDKGQRAVAKTINFGVLYGMGVVRLARELNISRKQAGAFIQRYRRRIAGVRDFLDGLVRSARNEGYARTLLGRRRPLPELRSRNRGQQALGERLAINTPIQGTAADVIKLAMVNIQARLDGRPDLVATMLLQVHDELVFEVVEEQIDALQALVVEEMEGAVDLEIPLRVEVGVGHSWAEL